MTTALSTGADARRTVHGILRVGVAGCFIGHGAFGVITKSAWLPYFAVGGIGAPVAWRLMPWIGSADIALGLLALLWPCRALFLWATVWATWTALLRPLAGEGSWEFFERAGNFGVPLAILVLAGGRPGWFRRLPLAWPASQRTAAWLTRTLRLTTATLLAGHGGCEWFLHKAVFAQQYSLFGGSGSLAPWLAGFEFALAGAALFVRRPAFLFLIAGWKIATELLYPLSGAPVWEFVERFGSYTAPLALAWWLYSHSDSPSIPRSDPVALSVH